MALEHLRLMSMRPAPSREGGGGDRGCGATSPQPMDDYPGSPHDLSLLTMYHVHMVRNMFDVIVRFYNFNVFV